MKEDDRIKKEYRCGEIVIINPFPVKKAKK